MDKLIKKCILKVLENGPLETKDLVVKLIQCSIPDEQRIYGAEEILSTLHELCSEDAIESFQHDATIFYKLNKK